ncbi:MAG: hypothetical protein IKH10_03435 [Bacteroidetes bacterium]|nr:hypothetical protein [Bacteroidota bacterium]
MPKQTLLIVLFLASFKIFAQPYDPTADPIDFIGDIPYNEQETIRSALNMGIYVSAYTVLTQNAITSPCDTLYDVDDTISGCNWTTLPWESKRAVVNNIPGFPGCIVIATYMVKDCPYNPFIRQIKLVSYTTDFYLPGSNIGCDSLASYLDTNDLQEKNFRLSYIEDYLYQSISEHEAGDPANFSLCDPYGNPSSNSIPRQIFYREMPCKSKVLLEIKKVSETHYLYVNVPCTTVTGCCKTWFTFCKDSLGNVVTHINRTPVGSICNGFPTESVIENIVYSFSINPNFIGAVITPTSLPCENTCN